MKTNKQITLTNDDKSTTSGSKELYFTGKGVQVRVKNGICATVTTNKGVYTLVKHPTLGIYQGTTPTGIKIHVTHKAWVGKLIFWA